jgi:hypothetical protein
MAHQNEISAAAKFGSNFMDFNNGVGQGPQQ